MEIYGIRGRAYSWFSSYLNQRQLRAKCRIGTGSSEVSRNFEIAYGMPQGSCLGPLLFIIFCNDLKLHLTYLSYVQFADDTTLYASGKSLRLIECEINHDLEVVSDWFRANKLTLNVAKTVCMVFSPKKNNDNKISVKLCDQELPIQTSTKFLGVWLDSNLDWNKHFSFICSKLKQNTGLMRRCKNLLTTSTLRSVYFAHIHSHLSYSILVWGSTIKQSVISKLQKMQNTCIKILKPNMGLREGFKELKIPTVNQLINIELCKFFYKLVNKKLPISLTDCVPSDSKGCSLLKSHQYGTRKKHLPNLPIVHDLQHKRSFLTRSNVLYNELPDTIKNSSTLVHFAQKVKELHQLKP